MSKLGDLAQSLGLSITSVSRAFGGYSDAAPATRKRGPQAARAGLPDHSPLSTVEIAGGDVGRRRAEAPTTRLGGRDYWELQTTLPVQQVSRAMHGKQFQDH